MRFATSGPRRRIKVESTAPRKNISSLIGPIITSVMISQGELNQTKRPLNSF